MALSRVGSSDFARRLARAQKASFTADDGQVSASDPAGGTPASTTASATTGSGKSHTGSGSSGTGTTTQSTAEVLKPTGEKLSPVRGHHYSKIESGVDKGMYLNQLPGSPRRNEAFTLVERGGRTFHVYGSGSERVVVEIKHVAAH